MMRKANTFISAIILLSLSTLVDAKIITTSFNGTLRNVSGVNVNNYWVPGQEISINAQYDDEGTFYSLIWDDGRPTTYNRLEDNPGYSFFSDVQFTYDDTINDYAALLSDYDRTIAERSHVYSSIDTGITVFKQNTDKYNLFIYDDPTQNSLTASLDIYGIDNGQWFVTNLYFNMTETIAPVPIPASIYLFSTGLFGLVVSGIRNKSIKILGN